MIDGKPTTVYHWGKEKRNQRKARRTSVNGKTIKNLKLRATMKTMEQKEKLGRRLPALHLGVAAELNLVT